MTKMLFYYRATFVNHLIGCFVKRAAGGVRLCTPRSLLSTRESCGWDGVGDWSGLRRGESQVE